MTKRIRPTILVLTASLTLVAAAGCGGDSKQSQADRAAELADEQIKNPPKITDVKEPELKAVKVTPGPGEGDLDKKPAIPKQEGDPPTDIVAQDLIVGDGDTAKTGDSVSMQYVGVLYDTGKEFDSSWKRDKKPFDFTLGAGQVIKGWDQGIVGMRVGGRRRLIIPPDLAYGPQGQPPTIPANSTLVFDVDLEKVTAAKK